MKTAQKIVIRHKETGKFWCSPVFVHDVKSAATFDNVEDARSEVVWNIQHNDRFLTGSYEFLPRDLVK